MSYSPRVEETIKRVARSLARHDISNGLCFARQCSCEHEVSHAIYRVLETYRAELAIPQELRPRP